MQQKQYIKESVPVDEICKALVQAHPSKLFVVHRSRNSHNCKVLSYYLCMKNIQLRCFHSDQFCVMFWADIITKRCRLGLRPRPRWVSLQTSHKPLAGLEVYPRWHPPRAAAIYLIYAIYRDMCILIYIYRGSPGPRHPPPMHRLSLIINNHPFSEILDHPLIE